LKKTVLSLFLFGAILSAAPANVSLVNAGSDSHQKFFMDPTAASAIPQPTVLALMGGGLFATGATRRFRRKKQAEVKT